MDLPTLRQRSTKNVVDLYHSVTGATFRFNGKYFVWEKLHCQTISIYVQHSHICIIREVEGGKNCTMNFFFRVHRFPRSFKYIMILPIFEIVS